MFKTRAEVDEYLSHDKLECLICGKQFHMLANHLWQKHNISKAAYQKMFGLPSKRPLCSPEMSRIATERIKERMNPTSKHYEGYRKWLGSLTKELRVNKTKYVLAPFLKEERKALAKELTRNRSIGLVERNKFIADNLHIKTGILAKKLNLSCVTITKIKRVIKERNAHA